jgi:hypothetical protein
MYSSQRADADVGSEKTLRLKSRHRDGNGSVESIEASEVRQDHRYQSCASLRQSAA